MKFENSLNAAISTVHEPDNCSSILAITDCGSLPLYGEITLSLYSSAASIGSRFKTVSPLTSSILTPLLSNFLSKTSCKLDAGSVLIRSTFFPSSASFTAVAQAIEVFPTPPFPVKKIYFVRWFLSGIKSSYIFVPPFFLTTSTRTSSFFFVIL